MAKLVEILAKELGEWPEVAEVIVQDADSDSTCWSVTSIDAYIGVGDCWELPDDTGGYFDIAISRPSQLAVDHATAIVTREMWQAERDRAVTGQGVSGDAGAKDWRLTESPSLHCQSVGRVYRGEDPRTSRDRIREIDATIEAMTAERAELVSKLAGEGFALIVVAAEPVEDMSDWRNWKVGDLVERVSSINPLVYTQGSLYKVDMINSESVTIEHDGKTPSNSSCCVYSDADDLSSKFRWHSRPTA